MLVNIRSAFLFAGNTCAFSLKKVTRVTLTNVSVVNLNSCRVLGLTALQNSIVKHAVLPDTTQKHQFYSTPTASMLF